MLHSPLLLWCQQMEVILLLLKNMKTPLDHLLAGGNPLAAVNIDIGEELVHKVGSIAQCKDTEQKLILLGAHYVVEVSRILDHSLLYHKGGGYPHIPHHLVLEHIAPHLGHAVADHSTGIVQIAVLAVDHPEILKI